MNCVHTSGQSCLRADECAQCLRETAGQFRVEIAVLREHVRVSDEAYQFWFRRYRELEAANLAANAVIADAADLAQHEFERANKAEAKLLESVQRLILTRTE